MSSPDRFSRIRAFDSLRGLAACTVVISHVLLVMRGNADSIYADVYQWAQAASDSPLNILWHGHAAVVLFFVLSGFVLYLLLAKATLSIPAYVIKRVIRLYVPYLVAVVLGIAGAGLVSGMTLDGFNHWANKFWSWPVTLSSIGEHLLFIGQFNADRYDFTIWTLVHEMRISLLFPIIFLFVRHLRWWLALLPFALASIAMVVMRQPGIDLFGFADRGGLTAYVLTIHYMLAFAIGASLAHHRNGLFSAYRRLPRRTRILLGILTFMLYAYGSQALQITHLDTLMPYDWPIMAGAALLLVTAAAEPAFRRLLETSPALYLGRISYSLYLFHPIVLLAMLHLFADRMPLGWLLLATLPLCFVVSDLAWRTVERPAVHLSRTVSGQVDRLLAERDARRPRTDSLVNS